MERPNKIGHPTNQIGHTDQFVLVVCHFINTPNVQGPDFVHLLNKTVILLNGSVAYLFLDRVREGPAPLGYLNLKFNSWLCDNFIFSISTDLCLFLCT